MNGRVLDQGPLRSRLKYLVAEMFRPDMLEPDKIANDEPLRGARFCLDSLDALELAMRVEEEFGIAIRSGEDSHDDFASIASLADLIQGRAQKGSASRYIPTASAVAFQLKPRIGWAW